MRIWASHNTSTANSRDLSPVARLPSEASATSVLSATNAALMKLLPGFVQNSLAPIARGDAKKKSTSSTERDRLDVGSESSRRRLSRQLNLNLGWGAGGENDKAPPRESAAETREKRAVRREMD